MDINWDFGLRSQLFGKTNVISMGVGQNDCLQIFDIKTK